MVDMVNHPPHYSGEGIECIDYIEQVLTPQEFVGYLRGNVIKYQHRLLAKGTPSENAEKAKWYLTRLVRTLRELESLDAQQT